MKTPSLIAKILSLVAIISSISTAGAAIVTWTGGGGADNAWSTGANWDTLSAPAAGDSVVFGADANGKTINLTANTNDNLDFTITSAVTTGINFTGAFELRLRNSSTSTIQNGAGPVNIGAILWGSRDQATITSTISNLSSNAVTISRSTDSRANLTLSGGAWSASSSSVVIVGGHNLSLAANTTVNLSNGASMGNTSSFIDKLNTASSSRVIGGDGVSNVRTRGTGTIAGTLEGNLAFTRGRSGYVETGTTILTNNNTYTGNTTQYSGTLVINGTHTGGSTYLISAKLGPSNNNFTGGSSTLSGIGSIDIGSNNLTFAGYDMSTAPGYAARIISHPPPLTPVPPATIGYGIFAPGTDGTIGNFTAKVGTAFFDDLSIFKVDIGAASSSDRFTLDGNLDLSNLNNEITFNSLPGAWDGSIYTIATFTGTLTGTFSNVVGLDSGYSISYNANSITLVPEPGTALLFLGGVSLLALGRRYRRS